MQQAWNIRSRSPECALSGQPFVEGEPLYTAIYFDPETGGFLRRDIAIDAWEQEISERTPFSFWKTQYEPQVVEEKPEIAPKMPKRFSPASSKRTTPKPRMPVTSSRSCSRGSGS